MRLTEKDSVEENIEIIVGKSKGLQQCKFSMNVTQESAFLQLFLVAMEICVKKLEKWKQRVEGCRGRWVAIIHFSRIQVVK